MRSALSTSPSAAVVMAVTVGVWLALEIRQSLNRRAEATRQDRGSLWALRAWVVVGALLAAVSVRVGAASFRFGGALLDVSFLCMWVGIALRWWCFRTLGHYFTFAVMTSADQRVITSGPYRLLRHPSYLGLLLIIFGIGMSYGNWLSLAALTVAPLIGFVYRIRVEEDALSRSLGTAYTSYAAGRKRLIPYVW